VQRVGYHTPLQQFVFFELLTKVGDLSNCSVLDVGCGLGALYGYLHAGGFNGVYTGVELVPHLWQDACQRYPEADFRQGDVLKADLPRYDYVIASGLFDYETPGMRERLRATLTRMFDLCRLGLAWNKFLLAACTRPEHYGEPLGDLLAVCDVLTTWLVLRRDYAPGHATFYLYKPAAFGDDVAHRLAGQLFLRPEFRQRAEMEPEVVMAEFGVNAQQLGRLVAFARRVVG